jgi:GR25 family glycosyltransferase involved in LPS biosynthesis
MRRSCDSFSSLTSVATSIASRSSINSRTKLYSNRDFQKYIAILEDDILRNSNHCYTIDKKINNIVNRYENRTNQLFMDLRQREIEHKRLCNKMGYILKNDIYIDVNDDNVNVNVVIERHYRYMLVFLYAYTFVVLAMVWNL